LTGNATEENITYILSELSAWKQLLLKTDVSQAFNLLEQITSFPEAIQEALAPLLHILKLRTFFFTNDLVHCSELRNLLSLASNSFSFFCSYQSRALKRSKIIALEEMEARFERGEELPEVVAKDIKANHPLASQGIYSRTKGLLLALERVGESRLTNAL